jgi:hypothetical protein
MLGNVGGNFIIDHSLLITCNKWIIYFFNNKK